ncbi:flavin reductase family protein [Salininema proteolyticum]|uniref:Flavin reductase family protein n=1 Tax=Salininema proteolyticum TaxID=1607685 RepID=A0ABV8TZS6_9ACTN
MDHDQRLVMRQFATGVCVASIHDPGPVDSPHDAVTVNSVTSLSLDPPLMSLCLRHDSRFLDGLRRAGGWALSILSSRHADLALALAKDKDARSEAVAAMEGTPGRTTGALVLDGPGWIECELEQTLALGDHTMAVGRVVAAGVREEEDPLVFLEGRFRRVAEAVA